MTIYDRICRTGMEKTLENYPRCRLDCQHLRKDTTCDQGLQLMLSDLTEAEKNMTWVEYQATKGERVEFEVYGLPQQQGSTKSFYIKKLERVVTTHTNRDLLGWRQEIGEKARSFMPTFYKEGKHSYALEVTFYVPRPQSAPKKRRYPNTRPDLDKYLRGVNDALTGVLIGDDAEIVDIHCNKAFGDPKTVIVLTRLP